MLWFGHIAFSYILCFVLSRILNLTPDANLNYLFLIGLIASIIPDLDTWILFYKYKSLKFQAEDSHRRYISHAPLVWIFTSLLIYFISTNDFVKYAGLFILVGSMSHFIGDSFEYGIMWLWPFSKKQFSMHKIPKENFRENEPLLSYYWKFFSKIYVKNWTFYIEIISIIIALIIII